MINFTVMITLEIWQSYQAALNAYHGGAHRIELCADLLDRWHHPDINITKSVPRTFDSTFVLIRPRDGNFYYSHSELSVIQDQIKAAVDAGAAGIVCGALTEKMKLTRKRSRLCSMLHKDFPSRFTRAFERSKIHLPHWICWWLMVYPVFSQEVSQVMHTILVLN